MASSCLKVKWDFCLLKNGGFFYLFEVLKEVLFEKLFFNLSKFFYLTSQVERDIM